MAFRSPLDLGFYPGEVELGSALPRQRLYWTCASFLLLVAGIFFRQCMRLPPPPPLSFSLENFQVGVAVGSLLLAFAMFGPFLRWFNRRKSEPSWEHVLWAFTFGFFCGSSIEGVVHLMRFLPR